MNTASPIPTDAQDVLDYWLGDGLQNDWPSTSMGARWFGGGPEQDADIRQRFGALVKAALKGGLKAWEPNVTVRLALIILLDQFTRNVYRGQALAFSGDGRSQQLVLQTLALEQDLTLPRVARLFLYMPLMHAEAHGLQDESLLRFTRLLEDATPELRDTLAGNLRFAYQHRDIIARFGRFPYRNAALGRPNTPEEDAFLKDGPRFGQ